ncbi:T-cell receptor alpha chain V region RL-5 [Solea senegalensis]|nr:T-cell receptor alpha chain V region RL-5 [Solea senegalensis]
MDHGLWMIVAALVFECKGQDRVMQPQGDVTAAEGHTFTLGCTFQTSDPSPTLFWYKQEVNGFPKFLLQRFSTTADNPAGRQEERINAVVNNTSVPLKIHKLQLSDSAVYYCAMRPTVTGNTTTLYKNTTSTRGSHTLLHLSVCDDVSFI